MDNRRWWLTPTILGIALIVALVWGYNEYSTKNELGVALENHYQRLFFDIKKHVENVQVNLSKAMASKSRDQNILLLSQIMNEAYFAQDKLGQLPITHAETANTEKFLNQAADYSYHLIQTHLKGEPLTKQQEAELNNLQKNSITFNNELAQLQSQLSDKNFLMGSLSGRQNKKIKQGNEKILQTTIANIEKTMGETPELIYDGPFSDQILNKKPVGLPDKDVSRKEAERIATEFIGRDKVQEVEPFEEGEHADSMRIPSYTFNIRSKNASRELATYISVSRKGGKVLWMANSRAVPKGNLSVKDAEKKALEFLKEKGFDNMEANYHLKQDGTILFNFVNKENNIVIYPDLVKVKVALDNGEIVGFDASTYYLNHQDREFETPKLTEAEARDKIRQNFNINSTRLALIPKGKNEKLCYEFKGRYNNADFIVYINALNGNEEEILQIIQDENGTLTF